MSEKFIVRVIRKRSKEVDGNRRIEEVDQIYEQEFDSLEIGEFALKLNRKDGKETDNNSVKL